MKRNTKYYLILAVYGLFTISVIYFSNITKNLASWITRIDTGLDSLFAEVMNSSSLGIQLRHILSLALTPIVIVAIPAGIYWFRKKKLHPYLIQIIWVLWMVTALSRLLTQ